MKDILVVRGFTGTGVEVTYVPVPCRGTVKSVSVVSDLQMVAAGTLTISRDTVPVNLVTVPSGNIAAGVVLKGVPDATNRYLIFDPDSVTVTDKVIKITDDDTFLAAAATVSILITFDDSAFVEQKAA